MANLTGTEILQVIPLRWDGTPSPVSEQTTTRAIANLASVPGAIIVKPSGTTDDTAAVQAALNAGGAAGIPVHLTAGVYFADGLAWPSGLPGVFGDGMYASIIRRRGGSVNNSVLSINNANAFAISSICLDGNKSANSNPCHVVIASGNWDYQFHNVRVINAKGSGASYGGGIAHTRDSNDTNNTACAYIGCEGYNNDSSGFFGQNCTNVAITDGCWCNNGGTGISWQNGTTSPTVISGLTIEGNVANRNGSTGIGVSSWGYGATATSPSSGAIAVSIVGNQVKNNPKYGIVYQASQGQVSNNVVEANGASNSGTGILFNGILSKCSGNSVENNPVFFGIDSGGSFNCSITGNHVWNNGAGSGGIGINCGGSQNTEISRNSVGLNATAQISFDRQEAGINYWPWDSANCVISENQIVLSGTMTALVIKSMPSGMVLENNRISGGNAPVGTDFPGCITSSVRGNRYLSVLTYYSIAAATAVVVPNLIEDMQLTGGGTVSNIMTVTQSTGLGDVTAVLMTNLGTGYTSAPAITFTGGGGSGATATAFLSGDGRVSQIVITNNGSGYTSAPAVVISGGGGTGAVATAYVGSPMADGREFNIYLAATTTLAAGGNLALAGAISVTAPAGSHFKFRTLSGNMVEVARQVA